MIKKIEPINRIKNTLKDSNKIYNNSKNKKKKESFGEILDEYIKNEN